jgi:hypothetical protein
MDTADGDMGSASGGSSLIAPPVPFTHSVALAWTSPTCTAPSSGSGGDDAALVPGPRAAHSCNLVNDRLWVFGGWNGKQGLADLAVLDVGSMEWSLPKVSGAAPSARNNHATFVHGAKLYLHGGHDGQRWLGDLWCLDTARAPGSLEWEQLQPSGIPPSPRACHNE